MIVEVKHEDIAKNCYISRRTSISSIKKLVNANIITRIYKPTNGERLPMAFKINVGMADFIESGKENNFGPSENAIYRYFRHLNKYGF